MRRVVPLVAVAVLGACPLLGACTDFATPAELTKPTVLAVIADPPIVPPGGSTQLSVVLAGPDGPMQPDATTWTLVETLHGIPPFGEVDAGATGSATYHAPAQVPPLPDGAPPIATVQLVVTAGDTTVDVLKVLAVVSVPSANPTVASFTLDGAPLVDGTAIDHGTAHDLAIATDPEATDSAEYAWYATAGKIDQYVSNPTKIVAGDAGDGWIYAVVRDGKGGVAWQGARVTVR